MADAGGYPTAEELDRNTTESTNRRDVPPPPSIITAEIDLEYLESIRQRMPIEVHRRNANVTKS